MCPLHVSSLLWALPYFLAQDVPGSSYSFLFIPSHFPRKLGSRMLSVESVALETNIWVLEVPIATGVSLFRPSQWHLENTCSYTHTSAPRSISVSTYIHWKALIQPPAPSPTQSHLFIQATPFPHLYQPFFSSQCPQSIYLFAGSPCVWPVSQPSELPPCLGTFVLTPDWDPLYHAPGRRMKAWKFLT